jgi:hypothetical protein
VMGLVSLFFVRRPRQVGTASFLFKRHTFWALSALAGIMVGAVGNYAMRATYAWEKQWPKSNAE